MVAVFYCNEDHYAEACLVADRLGLPSPQYNEISINKGLQQSQVKALAPPLYLRKSTSADAARSLVNSISGKSVAKPARDTGGSRNIVVLDPARGHKHHEEQINLLLNNVASRDYLIEPWIDGTVYCADGVLKGRKPYLLSIGEYVKHPRNPVVISGIAIKEFWSHRLSGVAHTSIEEWLRLLDFDDGPFHIEFIDSDGVLRLVEAHGRFGGSVVPESIWLATGRNPFTWEADIGQVSSAQRFSNGSVILFAYAADNQLLSPCDDAFQLDDVRGYRIHGSRTAHGPPNSAEDRVGYLTFRVTSREDVGRMVQEGCKNLGLLEVLDTQDQDAVVARLESICREW